jgi:serine/threonine protein kinase/Tfp pilus assembly protein PilF
MSAPDKPDDSRAQKAGPVGGADSKTQTTPLGAATAPEGMGTMVLSLLGSELRFEEAGSMIGPYQLVQTLGEGGMGTVWLAQQEKPIRRQVALKIIKLGMDTREIIARFEAERQALALMDHPNIAKVLDAGATGTGRPYFVMDLVRGAKITTYCDQNHLSTRERLKLFIQACRAIQHAHQKGIIHRDIKPSNILVTVQDAAPVPKVIDFGIAKATGGQQLTDKTLLTAAAQVMGTPTYMSPEQTRLGSLDIDTRTDIYSLGVLLYELLTGQTPFDPQELLSDGLDSIRKVICQKEPLRPSSRLGTLSKDDRTTVAKLRRVQAPNLMQLVCGDLDWIVMKCLEKDRARRYQTANDLALDIQRHLDSAPVEARPPAKLYRFQKLVQRNKLAFASAVSLFLLLLAGTVISTWQARKALAAEAAAKTEAANSDFIARFLQDMFKRANPWVAQGRDTTLLRELLDQTAETIDTELQAQPEVEARLSDTMGNVYMALALYSNAADMHRQAMDVWQKLSPSHAPQLAVSINNLANALAAQTNRDQAEAYYRRALAIQTNLPNQSQPEIATNLATTLDNLARLLHQKHDLAGSETLYRKALDLRQKLAGGQSLETAASLNGLAVVLRDKRDMKQSESLYRQALAIRRALNGNDDPDVPDSLNDLAIVLRDQGRFAEAEQTWHEALGIYERILDTNHPTLATALNNVGIALLDQRKLTEAETIFRRVLAMQTKRLGNKHSSVAQSLANLGAVLKEEQGRLTEAENTDRQALEIRTELGDKTEIANAMSQLAGVLQQENKTSQAIDLYRECLAIRQTVQPDAWETFNTRSELGGSLLALQQYTEAQPLLISGYQGLADADRQKFIPAFSRPLVGHALERLVAFYTTNGPPAQAADWQNKLARFKTDNANSRPP